MLKLDQIKSAISEIVSSYPVKKVSLFGSYAEDAATENSDIDILVEFLTPSISLFTLIDLKYAIDGQKEIEELFTYVCKNSGPHLAN